MGIGSVSTMRLFIAIDLSDTLRRHLSEQIDQLTRLLGDESIRWVKVSNIHLTLKFLGETSENKVDGIKHTLRDIASRFSSFDMQIGEFGCFPNLRKPRVFWIGVHEDTGALKRLHKVIETDLEKLGFDKEGRPFAAHLTLGRLRKRIASSEMRMLTNRIESVQIGELGTEQVKEICLIHSVLRPSGAEYIRLGTYKFRDAQ
jgi:2'-5' RNA ligase